LPSRARPKKVSKNSSVSSAGRSSPRTTLSLSSAFHQWWDAGRDRNPPRRRRRFAPPLPTVKRSSLARVPMFGGDSRSGSQRQVERKQAPAGGITWVETAATARR
jgi:hypothetical protein